MADQGTNLRYGSNYVLRALRLFEDYGEQEALVWQDQRLSHRGLANMTVGFADALRATHVEPGSVAAMLVPDEPATAALQLALHLLGCRVVWIASYAPAKDQTAFIDLTKPDVLIYHPAMLAGAPPVADLAARTGLRTLPIGTLAADGPGDRIRENRVPVASGPEPESLFYTGGTTGTPKVVRHKQRFYDVMLSIATFYLTAGEPPMRFLSGSSFSHVSGQLAGFLTLFEGGTLFLGCNGSPEQFLATVEREKVSSAFLTPTFLYEVTEHPKARSTDTSSLRYLNVGGAPALPARLTDAIEVFGPVVRLVYGSSEAPLITDLPFLDHDPEHPHRLLSCGKPFADSRIEIRDSGGAALPTGEAGEVWVGGSLIMNDYWQQPELTAETVRKGWLRTGDIGYTDDDGFLYLVDRMHDMIVTSSAAANVYARPIEDALASHPLVKSAAVIGVPDELVGEAVHAFVVPAPGSQDLTAEELRALVRERLNNLYTPRGIDFVDELPLTPLGKVNKKLLRQRYAETAQPASVAVTPQAPPG
jgi:fatty-acyl-CoA synthase